MAAVKTTDAYVVGLNELLRDLRGLDKQAQDELRDASKDIAERLMVPAWQEAAENYAGPWGAKIAQAIKAKRDRIPSVNIGSARKTFSGGASPTMVRYPSDQGVTRPSSPGTAAAFGDGADWMSKARTYIGPALGEWGNAVEKVVRDVNNDRFGV